MVSVVDLMKARAKATLQTQVLNWDLWHSNGACQQHFPFLPFSIHGIRNYYNVFGTFFENFVNNFLQMKNLNLYPLDLHQWPCLIVVTLIKIIKFLTSRTFFK